MRLLYHFPRVFVLFSTLVLVLAACGSDSGDDGGTGGTPIDPGGCVQPPFPAEQPDLSLFNPPRFLLTTSGAMMSPSGQATVPPGVPAEAEITVDGETRKAIVELVEAFDEELGPVDVVELDTQGNETLQLMFLTEFRGQYFMRITLCGEDCDVQQVLFDTKTDVNDVYERTVIENGETVQVDDTCLDFRAVREVGSGTIFIQ